MQSSEKLVANQSFGLSTEKIPLAIAFWQLVRENHRFALDRFPLGPLPILGVIRPGVGASPSHYKITTKNNLWCITLRKGHICQDMFQYLTDL